MISAESVFRVGAWTREGCSCFRDLFGGYRGKLRASAGKIAGEGAPEKGTKPRKALRGIGPRIEALRGQFRGSKGSRKTPEALMRRFFASKKSELVFKDSLKIPIKTSIDITSRGYFSFFSDSVQTRCIVKTSGFTRGVCENREFN